MRADNETVIDREVAIDRLKAFYLEAWNGKGTFELRVFRSKHAAMIKDKRFSKAVGHWMELIKNHRRPLCLACDHAFVPSDIGNPKLACLWMVPSGDEASHGMLGVACETCSSKTDEELMQIQFELCKTQKLVSWMKPGKETSS